MVSLARGTGRANDPSRNDEVNKRVHAPAKYFTRVLLNVLRRGSREDDMRSSSRLAMINCGN